MNTEKLLENYILVCCFLAVIFCILLICGCAPSPAQSLPIF